MGNLQRTAGAAATSPMEGALAEPVLHDAVGRTAAGRQRIVARISDGLGNQLFQYAFARRLSLELGRDLILDYSACRRYYVLPNQVRPYRLNQFQIQARTTSLPVMRWVSRLAGDSSAAIRETRFYMFDGAIREAIDSASRSRWLLLSGYWQSYRYFADYTEVLRAELMPRPGRASTVSIDENQQTVLVHVRRGDYVNSMFTLCSLDYYREAIDYIRARVTNPLFLIFSDDTQWVREQFCPALFESSGNHQVVDDGDEVSTFRRMHACDHFIIANSTFSWWPAYLGRSDHKIVIAPSRWLHHQDWDVELFPDGWVRL